MTTPSKEDVVQWEEAAGLANWWNNGSDWKETFDFHLTQFATLASADLVAENERLREQIKCGHSMEIDAMARERDELLVENERLKDAQFKRLEREAEKRMELRTALAAAEARETVLLEAF